MDDARASERLEQLFDGATEVFLRHGYSRAQMAQVARAAGVAPGTLYLYFGGKEALFLATVEHALDPAAFVELPELPIEARPTAELENRVREHQRQWRLLTPSTALARRDVVDIRDELEALFRELYTAFAAQRLALKLVERSALDWPSLHALYESMRTRLALQLTHYLERRIAQRLVRPVPSAPAAARLALETIAWCALERPADPEAGALAEESARETVVHLLVHALAPT